MSKKKARIFGMFAKSAAHPIMFDFHSIRAFVVAALKPFPIPRVLYLVRI